MYVGAKGLVVPATHHLPFDNHVNGEWREQMEKKKILTRSHTL
jgi:hypothetical protein